MPSAPSLIPGHSRRHGSLRPVNVPNHCVPRRPCIRFPRGIVSRDSAMELPPHDDQMRVCFDTSRCR